MINDLGIHYWTQVVNQLTDKPEFALEPDELENVEQKTQNKAWSTAVNQLAPDTSAADSDYGCSLRRV